jgi:hypothetical protein
MDRFRSGNVIRTKEGSLEIVVDVRTDGYTNVIYVNYAHASGGHRDKTYQREEHCSCGMLGCNICDLGERVFTTVYGMEDAVLVAPTVKDWITKTLLKGFDF